MAQVDENASVPVERDESSGHVIKDVQRGHRKVVYPSEGVTTCMNRASGSRMRAMKVSASGTFIHYSVTQTSSVPTFLSSLTFSDKDLDVSHFPWPDRQ